MKRDNVVLITGATGAIGRELAMLLACDGVPLLLACRDTWRGDRLRDDILLRYPQADVMVKRLDLSSLEGVRAFSQQAIASLKGGLFAALVNNAGTIAPCYHRTSDGWEMNAAINYISPWLLTCLLAPSMASGGVIVNVASCTTRFCSLRGWFPDAIRQDNVFLYNRLRWYARSKRALLLSSDRMAFRFKGLRVAVVDPGIVDSGMITMNRWFDPLTDCLFRPLIKRPYQGAAVLYRALYQTPLHGSLAWLFRGKSLCRPLSLTISQQKEAIALWHETDKQISLQGD